MLITNKDKRKKILREIYVDKVIRSEIRNKYDLTSKELRRIEREEIRDMIEYIDSLE